MKLLLIALAIIAAACLPLAYSIGKSIGAADEKIKRAQADQDEYAQFVMSGLKIEGSCAGERFEWTKLFRSSGSRFVGRLPCGMMFVDVKIKP